MTIVGDFDIAQLCLYAFWVFFFCLIVYLQRESAREGYPLELETKGGGPGRIEDVGPFGVPAPKTFRLPHGQGEVTVPNPAKDAREITDRHFAMRAVAPFSGAPFAPTGDPMADGIGPAAWAERADHPDLTVHGEPKITPMSASNEWSVSDLDRDIRGYAVIGCDGLPAGTVSDLWVDRSEYLIRYVEVALADGGSVLCPMNCVAIPRAGREVRVHSLKAAQFAGVPRAKAAGTLTHLEEERIMAYYAGGKLYADARREEPWL